ncbi:MAG: transglycosylase domain-containing protein, partial [Clostridia bacterium]|nr:transglycosylase domain-containing protein [Clostridia bacterium]
MSQFDEFDPKGSEETPITHGSRRRRTASEKKKTVGFKAKFASFMRKLNDPGRRRKRRLPDPSEYPEGQVPLWVSDPDHYVKKRSRTRRFFSAFGTVCLHLFLIFCMMGVVVLGIGAAVVYSYSDTALDERFASMDLDHSSFIYATDPNTGGVYVYQEIQSSSGRRVWVSDTEIPQHVKDATVAIEDKRFYSHMGVDPIRTVNAVLEYAMGKLTGSTARASGGSTLTQQVIKNMTGEDDYGVSRKIKEMLQALYIERRYDKDQILEYYLNTVYFGNSANGISAAADIYFGKDVSELTIVEGAAIICITKSPSYYDPYKNPENNKERRNTVLWYMCDQGYITREQYDEFSQTELVLRDKSQEDGGNKTDEDGIFLYNYYSDMVIQDVLEDLQKAGYSKAEANRMLYYGGLQIYACVDPDVQRLMEDYFEYDDNYYTSSELKNLTAEQRYKKYAITVGEGEDAVEELPQVSMMVMDPYTGNILGIIGGRGEKNSSRDLNRATMALRQPGSSIKPLSIYGYAVENGIVSLGSPIDDAPVETRAKDEYAWPKNYDG